MLETSHASVHHGLEIFLLLLLGLRLMGWPVFEILRFMTQLFPPLFSVRAETQAALQPLLVHILEFNLFIIYNAISSPSLNYFHNYFGHIDNHKFSFPLGSLEFPLLDICWHFTLILNARFSSPAQHGWRACSNPRIEQIHIGALKLEIVNTIYTTEIRKDFGKWHIFFLLILVLVED